MEACRWPCQWPLLCESGRASGLASLRPVLLQGLLTRNVLQLLMRMPAVASSPGNSWPASGVLVGSPNAYADPPRSTLPWPRWFCNDRVSCVFAPTAAAGGVFAPTADTCLRVFSKPEHVMCNDGSCEQVP